MQRINIIPIVSMALLLFGCMSHNKYEEPSFVETTMHFDDSLKFSIEHPDDWKRIDKPDQDLFWPGKTQIWEGATQKSGPPEVEMKITSVPLFLLGESENIITEYFSTYPLFVIEKKEIINLEKGSAVAITGKERERVYWILIIDFKNSVFVLDFSTLPNRYEKYLPIFKNIVDSFAPF